MKDGKVAPKLGNLAYWDCFNYDRDYLLINGIRDN